MVTLRIMVVDLSHEAMTLHGRGRIDKDVKYYSAFCPDIKDSNIDQRNVKIKTWIGEFPTTICWRLYTLENPGFINNGGLWIVHKLEGEECKPEAVKDFIRSLVDGYIFGAKVAPSEIERIIYTGFGFGVRIKIDSDEFDRYIETHGEFKDFSHIEGRTYEYPAILPDDQCTPEDYERGYCFMARTT